MSHPFEVGKPYRNRNGEYEVLDIEGEWMKIKYESGGTIQTRVVVQARIWENIQFEEQMAREEERQRLAKEEQLEARRRLAIAKKAKDKPKFAGFKKADFAEKKRGIAWGTRRELGKVLEYEMKERTKNDYGSWIVPRKPAVDVARKDRWDADARETNAAFYVSATVEGLAYGFHVGKPAGKVKANWPWKDFMAMVGEDNKARRALRAMMKQHELSLDVWVEETSYTQVAKVTIEDRGFLWQHETADQETTRKMNWPKLADYLETVAPDRRCDVFVSKRLSPGEAVKAGAGISAQILTLLEALQVAYDGDAEA
jgi:hypothetical protein